MADVSVKVELDADWEQTIKKLPGVKGALTKEAKRMCESANSMAAGYKSGLFYDPKTKSYIGETQAVYASKSARAYADDTVALVYTRNYAAKKENLEHNTLAKVIASG